MAPPVKMKTCSKRMPALRKTAGKLRIVPGIAMPSASTFISKNPFQPIMCEVKKKSFTSWNIGISNVVRIVNTMITLMVATIGPNEFSAKMEKKNPRDDTVMSAIAAKPNAQR